MHTSIVFNPSVFTRAGVAVALLVTALFAGGSGCSESQEGDRCNPSLSHQECNAGLSCQQPVDCPENYCCPINGTSSNPNCQPGCNGGLASICAADPTFDACVSDAAASTDAGPDAMSTDTGPADTGVADTGMVDTGAVDSGEKDSGPKDSGPKDTGVKDASEDSHG